MFRQYIPKNKYECVHVQSTSLVCCLCECISTARVATKQLLHALMNAIARTEMDGFTFADTLPALPLKGRLDNECRIEATESEKRAAGLPTQSRLFFYWDKSSGTSRWELAGGNHCRLIISGDLGSCQWSAFSHICVSGGAMMMWPDFQHLIIRREGQARDLVKNAKKVLARVQITLKVSRGPFHGAKHGRAMQEAFGRMMQAC
jgi:hypothetical protein